PDALHGAEIYGRAVIDFFSGKDRSFDDVINVGPVADLRAVAPDFERILPQEGARNHGDDRVILHASRTIHGKVTARSAAQTVLFGIGLQGEFTHQFGPAVGVVRVKLMGEFTLQAY